MTTPRAWPLFDRLPAHVINGIGAALGVALVQVLVGAAAGHGPALLASSGAIYASLADQPVATQRVWRRVLATALVGCGSALVVGLIREHESLLGLFIAMAGFGSAAMLAWGPRAGPVSFVGVLAFVFTMAAPAAPSVPDAFRHAGWAVLGSALYLGWATFVSRTLQPRLRTLSLAAAFDASARLLRSRATVLASEAARDDPLRGDRSTPLEAWIVDQAALDDSLQAARDLLYAAPASDTVAERQTAALLMVIDLRDSLLAAEPDLDLLRRGPQGAPVRTALGAQWHDAADALQALAARLRRPTAGTRSPARTEATLPALQTAQALATDGALRQSLASLADTSRHLADTLVEIDRTLAESGGLRVPLAREELQGFVSVEGLPLASLKPHFSGASPVLRHGVRAAVALVVAYVVGASLPWASHPHWLVLSVAVVLRGNLAQTLARLNARVAGTAAGCLAVLALAQVGATWLSTVAFLVAVGVAHAYVVNRYLITAGAATVMALMQAHLAHPAAGFAVSERLAETVLGALLAWASCYVLPSWERRGLPRTVARLTKALDALAAQVLRWPDGGIASLELRLARRETYAALNMLAATAERTAAEPERVRVPVYLLATLVLHSHALLAHLAAIKLALGRRARATEDSAASAATGAPRADIEAVLAEAGAGIAAQLDGPAAAPAAPTAEAQDGFVPWLRYRLALSLRAAAGVAHAAAALKAASLRR